MALGNNIVIAGEPKGLFLEGYKVANTPKPGVMMQIDVSEAEVGGRWAWEVYNTAVDAESGMVAILLNDRGQGVGPTVAYVADSRCFMYCPIAGEEMNILLEDVAGTADDFAIGDRLIVDDGTGKFLATTGTSHVKSEPFICLEVVTDPVADTLIRAMFTGY